MMMTVRCQTQPMAECEGKHRPLCRDTRSAAPAEKDCEAKGCIAERISGSHTKNHTGLNTAPSTVWTARQSQGLIGVCSPVRTRLTSWAATPDAADSLCMNNDILTLAVQREEYYSLYCTLALTTAKYLDQDIFACFVQLSFCIALCICLHT